MAYTGFISDPSYCRRHLNEEITGSWTFTKVINGTSMTAHWGDLAEKYLASPTEFLVPGTLVKFGGNYEITKTSKNDKECFGVISTNPGVVLNNKEKEGVRVALVGRVPVRVIGKINKFDKLTTSNVPGVAKKKTWLDVLLLKPTIGKSLHTNTNENEKIVESFVHSHI
jgi:hypothetical protein